jgi:uncharacterized protein (TIGR02284 family)
MIRPHSLDSETILRLRMLAVATYGGRDDLYAAAAQLSNEDLSVICRKLADDLAGNTAYLEQIIATQGEQPGFNEAIASALGEEIMKLLREGNGDHGIIAVVQQEQRGLREEYEATIAATRDAEARSVLEEQKRDVDFAERVLRHIAPPGSEESHVDRTKKR